MQTCPAGTWTRARSLVAPGDPAAVFVRFENVVGHFSTWALAIVTPRDVTAPVTTATLSASGTYGVTVSDAVLKPGKFSDAWRTPIVAALDSHRFQ